MTTKIAIPTTADELEAMLGDSARMQKVFADPSSFKEYIGNYARATMAKDGNIAIQVKEETQRVLTQWLKETPDAKVQRLNLDPNAPVNTKGQGLYSKTAPGAKIDAERIVDSNRDFLSTIFHGNRSDDAQAKRGKLDAIRNAFGSTVPSDGGFLIPESLRSELLRVALETAIVRPRARVVPMETLTVPFPTIDSTSHASNVYGGVTAFWTEESGTLSDTSAKFGRVKLEAKKLTAYSEVPNELFTDSIISLETFINEIFPEAIAWFEDIAFMRGTGVGEPLGFLNAPAAVSIAAEGGQGADTIVWENIVKMYSRMLPTSLGRAVWIAHIDTFPELATMALSVGTGGSAIWLNNGTEGPPMTILGRPVLFTEKAETIGDAGDINFVDLGYYLLGDRQAIQANTSPHYKFQNDQTAIRFIERVDGRPWVQSAITPNKGTNTLSPFVKIAARA
ncbi:phage major capsid protein [Promicromonospora sp. NPDC023805]|uniref:phage major capsid protein n=1 Tax=Promicromonospora sp. NPDC023805 TaxID=3154696 RepID=UPI0033F99B23